MNESKLYAYCLQGDVTAAYEYLQSIPNKSLKHQKLESKYYRRFFSTGGRPTYLIKTKDPWIRKVILAYYQYFTLVLTRKSVAEVENRLIKSLTELIPDSKANGNIDHIEKELEVIFKEKGFCFLGGVTPPYRGPFIWKTTDLKEFTVELPHQVQKVKVYFMSGFLLQSWIHFSTFGEKFAGGWAKSDGLYFVADRPKHKRVKLDSSEFQISYLKHEAQHQSDFARYPNLPPKDLEYRAKLVELIYEPNSLRLLKKFFYEQKNDARLPHPYSSYVILNRLSKVAFGSEEEPNLEQWKSLNQNCIRDWAWQLFHEHTEVLEANGMNTMGVI